MKKMINTDVDKANENKEFEETQKKDYNKRILPSKKEQIILSQQRRLQEFFNNFLEQYFSISNNFYLFDLFQLKEGSRVLDCGSGMGGLSFSFYLNKMNVCGIELSNRADIAKKIYLNKKTSKSLSFRKGNIFNEINEDEKFDFIYAKNFPIYYPDGINGTTMNMFLESLEKWSSDEGIFCWQMPSHFYGRRNHYILENEDYIAMINKLRNQFNVHHISYLNTPDHVLDEMVVVFIKKNSNSYHGFHDIYYELYNKHNNLLKTLDNKLKEDKYIINLLDYYTYPGLGIKDYIKFITYIYRKHLLFKSSTSGGVNGLIRRTLQSFRYRDYLKYMINSQIFYILVNKFDSVNVQKIDPFYNYFANILKLINVTISKESEIEVSSFPKYIKNPGIWLDIE
ncbi:MAG: methyltransferase domain-containing protein [Promethearchaeota archaeon]|jgi:SAM-dependent methyltransferase